PLPPSTSVEQTRHRETQRPRRRAARRAATALDERHHPRRATGVPRRRRAAPTSFSALDVERFGGLQRPSTSAPPSSTSSHRRTPAPSSTEFQAKGKPLRSGPKGLRMGPV